MKIKFSHILLNSATIIFVVMLSMVAFAQDDTPSPSELQDANHSELNIHDEDKTLIFESDTKLGKNTSIEPVKNATTTAVKGKNAGVQKPNEVAGNSNTKEEDDALSFNFLFYIIQKYKFADIIDQ